MTTYNKAQLKTYFEQGDIPTGTDYANLIDSQVNIAETNTQVMAGNLQSPQLITPLVNATDGQFTGTLTVANYAVSGFTSSSFITSAFNATGPTNLNSTLAVQGAASFPGGATFAGGLDVTSTLSIDATLIVSAAGTAQATAAVLTTNADYRLQGAVDGTTTGYRLTRSGTANFAQFLYNENAVSANLWPAVGCKINGLSANAAFGLVANTPYIVHQYAASAYWVK